MKRMSASAESLGADAIILVRFTTSAIAEGPETGGCGSCALGRSKASRWPDEVGELSEGGAFRLLSGLWVG